MRSKWFSRIIVSSTFMASLAAAMDEDVAKLASDAKEILAAHRVSPVSADRYAQCIFSLEKAQQMLESSGDSTSVQAQEVNATLFWAKRFSTLEISNELSKLRTGGGQNVARVAKPPVKPVASVPLKPAAPAANSMIPGADKLAAAKAGYQQAEAFAAKKQKDPFAVALRWFQVASNFSGTEYALKALERAQEAHARSAASGKVTPTTPVTDAAAPNKRALLEAEELKAETPEIVVLRAAEKFAESKEYLAAIEQFKVSIKIKDTVSAQSRLGYTYFKLAQTIQENLLPKYKEAEDEYAAAYPKAYKTSGTFSYFDDRSPGLVMAQRKINDLRKESDLIIINYVNAQACFERILKLIPGGKDFEAAAYAGISMAKRNEAKFRAKTFLAEFLKEYKPQGIGEQITYEYCKSELERINK